NDLPKNNFHGLANSHYFETYSNKHGVITRAITIQNGQITHESVKGNRTIKMPVNKSNGNNEHNMQKVQASQASQNFQDSDYLYFRLITNPENLEGNLKQYRADTAIVSTPKDAPTNITNQKHKLNLKDNYVSVQLWYVTSLGEVNANKELPTNISGVLDTTFYSDTNGLVDITFKRPDTENQEITITFPDYEDKLNARVIHKKGSMLDQKPVAITGYLYDYPNVEVYNDMYIQTDSLQKAYDEADLALFDFKSKYRTNDYAGGYLDLDNPEHRAINKSGLNTTWTSEHTDTLFIITSDINQHYGTPAHELEIQERDTVLTDLKKVLNLEGTSLEEWKRVNYSGPHKVDDILNNEIYDRIAEEYDGYNYANIYFMNFTGNSQSIDSLYRIKGAGIKFEPYSTLGNKVSEIFEGILNCRDPPTLMFKVADYFLATDITGYNDTQLTEACWGMTQQKLLLPQGYPLGR
ncbi:hypothetical protein K9L97_03535, partial [Candidatus Woesearchaeota archaeon]|nr:hypothetical protein [Candidatus Woesearchaeota archaeon]